jgi:hypothetical protein
MDIFKTAVFPVMGAIASSTAMIRDAKAADGEYHSGGLVGPGGSRGIVVYQVYRDKIYQDALRDQARAPGSAIRGIVSKSSTKIPGRRQWA